MKTIKVFLASSEELKEDRKEFVDMISKLNYSYNPKGICFKPLIWEYMSNALREKTKQEEYNEHIRECDVFVAIFHTRAGKYTQEELNIAYDMRCKNEFKRPTIQIYVRTPEKGIEVDSTMLYFLNELEHSYTHFKSSYSHIDTLKYEFMAQFAMLENEQKIGLTLQNGKICIDGVEFVDFENLSFASKNGDLITLKKHLKELIESIDECNKDANRSNELLLKYPAVNEFQEEVKRYEARYSELSLKKQNLEDDIQKHENSLLDFSLSLAREKAKSSSAWIRNATDRFNKGESKEARALLEELTESIYKTAREVIGLKNITKEKISYLEDQIKGVLLQADEVMTQYENANRFTQACEFYEKAIQCGQDSIAEIDQVSNIFTYSKFLKFNNDFKRAEHFYSRALDICKTTSVNGIAPDSQIIADILNELGFVHRVQNRHSDATTEHKEALRIYRILAKSNPDILYNRYIANTLNNLAYIHHIQNNFALAKSEYNEALQILSDSNRLDIYSFEISYTLNSLANLHKDLEEYSLAEEGYIKAMKIRLDLVAQNPIVYRPCLSVTLNNLANLHCEQRNYALAEVEYNEALAIRKELASKRPNAYNAYMATVINNMASIQSNVIAEENLREALSIYRFFYNINPETYAPHVADILNNLAIVHSKLGDSLLAESEYNEALEIRRDLAIIAPNYYRSNVAMTLNNMAILHIKQREYSLAQNKINEAIEILKDLLSSNTERNPYIHLMLQELLLLSNISSSNSIEDYDIEVIIQKQSLKYITSLD